MPEVTIELTERELEQMKLAAIRTFVERVEKRYHETGLATSYRECVVTALAALESEVKE